MKPFLCVTNLCIALCSAPLVALTACGSSNPISGPPLPDPDLIIEGDASFQGTHGGQSISVVVVGLDEFAVAQQSGTVSASDVPSFSFSFPTLLAIGFSYRVHYYIDSDDPAGSPRTCDPTDHQGSLPSFSGRPTVTLTAIHADPTTVNVCSKFTL
jgi:hypothetical protein